MQKRKRILSLIWIIAFCISISVLASLLSVGRVTDKISKQLISLGEFVGCKTNISDAALTASGKTALYCLREHEGKIGVFDMTNGSLLEVLDVYVYALPAQDVSYLSEGIYVYSFSELLSLIYDYTS